MKLSYKCLELHLAHTWAIARTTGTRTSDVVVVELQNSGGTLGRGEAAPTLRYKETVRTVQEFLAKIDPTRLSFEDVVGSMEYLAALSPGDMSAKCAVNIALLDGAGQLAGKPIHDLLGLGFTEGAHVTSFTVGLDRPDVVRQKVIAAESFPILKVKVGGPDDESTLRTIRSVARTKTVRVDANEGWKTREEALEKIEWLAQDKHIEYVEQPMPAGTPVSDWAWLKERSPLPIFGDESYHLSSDIDAAVECFHGVNVKLVKTGGISAGHEALKAARKAGLKTMIGCMIETSILISAAAHLAELCDYMDIDGNMLITNDPYRGVKAERGQVSFATAPVSTGLRVADATTAGF